MIRRMFLLVVLAIALAATNLGIPTPRGASDVVINAAAQEELIDLAWLAPGPSDLDDDGHGNGLFNGDYQLVVGGGSIHGLPGPPTPYDDAFSIASARQTYFQAIAIPDEDDPDIMARTVNFVIGEFADDDGAESGFVGVVDAITENWDRSRTPPVVGEEAAAIRGEFQDPVDGRTFKELRIIFRTGRFLADVFINDYMGNAPAPSEIKPVAELLEERLEAADAAESLGLAFQVVRFESPDLTTYDDYYTRRGGEEVRTWGVSTNQIRVDDEFYEGLGVTDVYYYVAEVLISENNEAFVALAVNLNLFTDRHRAETFLETAVDVWIENWGTTVQDIEVIDDADHLGDNSAAVSFATDTRFGILARGYQFWVRVGDRVAIVQLTGNPEVALPVALEIVEEQVACLEDGSCVEPLPVSEWSQAETGTTPDA